MSRRSRVKPQVGVSLFPFLAVLICTMGALIVLLLLMMVQAKVSAEELAVQQQNAQPPIPAEDQTALQQQLEDADWRRQVLEQQRAAKAEELATQRLELSHLEDHIRRLQDKWKDLEAQASQLQTQGDSKEQTRDKVLAEMAQIKAEIEQTKRDLEIARAVAASKPRSYSIIPYQGPNGTSRRPVYIECTGDFVIIQPEGVKLDARDFEGPLGPGNPLDACLRAIREYLARNPEMTKYGEPYPLLIVRPDGVIGYAAARGAMKSWEDEFGYELVEDETKLAYPAADPTLKLICERAIQDARRRQEVLAEAAPSRYRGTATGQGLRASAHGGFQEFMPKDPYGEGEGSGTGRSATGYSGADYSSGTAGNGSRNSGSNNGLRGDDRGSPGIGRGGGGFYNPGYAGEGTSGQGESRTPGVGTTARNYGGGQGGNGNERLADGGASSSTGVNSTGRGQRVGSGGGNGGSTSTGGQSQGGQAASGQPGGQAGGDASSGDAQPGSAQRSNAQPIASKRGSNWGLPNYAPKATGITRPIRLRIEPNEMLILPERGTQSAARIVPIEGSMSKATEAMVAQIWDEVDSWGIAVAGGYWKPVLNVEAAPGTAQMVNDLEALLEGSGLEVRRKSP